MDFLRNKPAITHRLIELTVLLSIILLALATRWGPGVGGDATIYMSSATNLARGHGLGLIEPGGSLRLLPYFPPFLSLLLSLFGLLGLDLVVTIRWLNILCFGGLVYLIGMVTYRQTKWSLFSILTALIVAVCPILIPVYSWAMSEPLSAISGFSGLAILLAYLQHPEKKSFLFWSAVLCGLSFLTRYSALAFMLAALTGILFFTESPIKKRLIDGFVYGVIASVPMVLWLVYDVLNTATVASRRVLSPEEVTGRLVSFWPLLRDAVLIWFIPESWFYAPVYPAFLNSLVVPLAGIGLVLMGFLLFRRLKKETLTVQYPVFGLMTLLVAFVLFYLLIIFGVYMTTYPPITIANRMLSPMLTALIWLVMLACGLLVHSLNGKKALQWIIYGLLIGVCLYYGMRSARIVKDYYNDGLGYTSPAWQQSQTIEALKKLSPETPIVTNETNAVLFLTGRSSYPFKESFLDKPESSFTRFGDGDLENDDGQKLFREGRAVLVLFDTIDDQLSGLYDDRTNERIQSLVKGLKRDFRGSDGGIFTYPQ